MIVKDVAISDFSRKVLEGTKRAVKKLVEETAAKNGHLIIGDANGNPTRVPAKDLLEKVKE